MFEISAHTYIHTSIRPHSYTPANKTKSIRLERFRLLLGGVSVDSPLWFYGFSFCEGIMISQTSNTWGHQGSLSLQV